MNAERWFFDTDILVYLFDPQAPEKQIAAGKLWQRASDEAIPVLSTQVLQEFFVTVTKAAKQGLPLPEARRVVFDFAVIAEVVTITVPLIERAIHRVETSGFSFWDSLIIETAMAADARYLLTEDLQHGQALGNLQICNPFVVSHVG
jgi:predicted nucleic acid-binding protein